MTDRLEERKESLWWLSVPPLIWTVHFLACYITAAVYCAKADGQSFDAVRMAFAGYTVVALAGVVATGVRGWRRHRLGADNTPHDDDTPHDRHRFLGFATFLLSGLAAVGLIYVALPAAFIGTCR